MQVPFSFNPSLFHGYEGRMLGIIMSIIDTVNAGRNAQYNAAVNAAPSNSGSKTGLIGEHSTLSIRMRICALFNACLFGGMRSEYVLKSNSPTVMSYRDLNSRMRGVECALQS